MQRKQFDGIWKRRKQLAAVLVTALVCGLMPVSGNAPFSMAEPVEAGTEQSYGLSNPVIDSGGITTWDCVYFGRYWQNDTNNDRKANKYDAKEPIKWRVLSVNGDDAFLLADQNLACQKYNNTYVSVTWETCTMRSWLNGYEAGSNVCEKDYTSDNFLDNAFSAGEKAAIRSTNIVNADNPEYGTEGGNDTTDKVYLLSLDEVLNPGYGFASDADEYAESRRAKNTAYAEAQGAHTDTSTEYAGNGNWWLRSPGDDSHGPYAIAVPYYGCVILDGGYVSWTDNAARPALHLNLSSVSEWSYAGKISSNGKMTEMPSPSPKATASPSPSAAPTNEPVQTEEPEKPSASPGFTPEETENPSPSSMPTNTPVQTEKPETTEKPSAIPSQVPGTQQRTVNPVHAPGIQTEAPVQTAPAAVQKPGKVTGLKLKAVKKGIQASWKKSKGAAGYEVWSSTSKKFTDKKARTVKAAKITINNLKKKTYYVKVRAYVTQNGKKVYGAWSGAKKKKVK